MNTLQNFFRIVAKGFVANTQSNSSGKSMAELRYEVKQLSALSNNLTSIIDKISLDLDDYAAENWRREKETAKKYNGLVINLLLILDHLENLLKSKRQSKDLEWILKKLNQLLEEEAIEEIEVNRGIDFNSRYHLQLKSRKDELPAGSVVEISRKGYYIQGLTPDHDVVLRQAEVIISDGPKKTNKKRTTAKEGNE